MKIVIAGAGAVGTHLSKLLSRDRQDCVLIDEDPERLGDLDSRYDIMTIQGRTTSINTMKEAGVENADLFVGVTPDESRNMNACMIAHALGAKKTVARIDNFEYLDPARKELFERMGINSLIFPEVLAAIDITNGLKMSWVRQRWDVHGGALIMLGIKLRESCLILNRPLKEVCGTEEPYHVVAIKRGNETIIPGGNDFLQLYDMAYFMTTREYIPYVRRMVGKEDYTDVSQVMIMGGGKCALRTAHTMPEYMKTKIIEIDPQRCEKLNDLLPGRGELVINGDARDTSLLLEEGIRHTQAFVALTGNSETNILACLAAKRLGVRKTVAVVENVDYIDMAESLDIGTIINKKAIAASRIYEMMLEGCATNLRFLMQARADVAEFTAQKNSPITKKKIFELSLPKGCTIGGLVRNGEGMLVTGGTQVQQDDIVVVFCHNTEVKRIEKLFN